MFFYPI
ncbi:hypothetical protein D047_4713A, partial [Vibrio parahaemolyticus VPTS-2010_2]